jgi:holliday junction DNA helicase RuvA
VISEIKGTLTSKDTEAVTVMTAAGIGYEVFVPVATFERLPRKGAEVHLYTNLVVREDSWSLFGFDEARDREVFRRLLTASGVGPRLALAMISALGGDRVIRAVHNGDLGALCTVPGVGRKKAERMVLELKDRMGDLPVPGESSGPGPASQQAVTALVGLGYGHAEADDAVRHVLAADQSAATADVIRLALQQLSGAR